MNEINFSVRVITLSTSFCWCLAGSVLAEPPPMAIHIQVIVRTIDQDHLSGELVRFNLDEGLVIQPEDKKRQISIPTADIVRISTMARANPQRQPYCLLLEGGDRLYGTISGQGPDQIVFDTVLGKAISIPLERIRACLTTQADQPKWEKIVRRLIQATSDEDQLLLSNGDLLHGFVNSIGPKQVLFDRQGREMAIDFDVIVAIVMAGEPETARRDIRARVQFLDGSILTVSNIRWSAQSLDLTFFDGTLQGLPTETIQQMEIRGAKWIWLSDLQPAFFEHVPLLSLKWPFRIDRSVTGGRLSIGGHTFQHGISVHSQAILRFDLGGKYQVFATHCGLDDSAGPLADVTASVIVDGTTRWQEAHIKAGSSPHRLRIDVTDAQTLELRVDYGDNGDVQDRFNWAAAALIR